MKANSVWITTLVCVLSGLITGGAQAAELRGSWTLAPSERPGHVEFGLMRNHEGQSSQHRGDWPVSAFQGLGSVQQATLAMVAPGIAEALIATAMGLFAAIPAVIAYNRYADQVGRLELRYDAFMEEFSTILQRHSGAGGR